MASQQACRRCSASLHTCDHCQYINQHLQPSQASLLQTEPAVPPPSQPPPPQQRSPPSQPPPPQLLPPPSQPRQPTSQQSCQAPPPEAQPRLHLRNGHHAPHSQHPPFHTPSPSTSAPSAHKACMQPSVLHRHQPPSGPPPSLPQPPAAPPMHDGRGVPHPQAPPPLGWRVPPPSHPPPTSSPIPDRPPPALLSATPPPASYLDPALDHHSTEIHARRALLVAIEYRTPNPMARGAAKPEVSYQLEGCINDSLAVRELLKRQFGFKDQDILTLREDIDDVRLYPTRKNIFKGISWLVKGASAGDKLFFHYSGHGGQKRDRDGDEADGYDETLLPLDFQRAGQITDDEIHERMVMPLPEGCVLHCVIDACHSGSVMDLPYMLSRDDRTWKRERVLKHSRAWVVCFSACDDTQTSADTSALAKTAHTGAMTFCFIEAIEGGYGDTYRGIMARVRDRLKNAKTTAGGGFSFQSPEQMVGGVLQMLMSGSGFRPSSGFPQKPQLSTSHEFDPNSRLQL
eukprot:m.114194 g.114194  ORF g.114194 m.114194 type:complete len:514 (-) comp15468_c0_seq4:992-2533(-)